MCELAAVIAFVTAHTVAWNALGRGWRGAARAPFAVFLPVVALLLLKAMFGDSYGVLPLEVVTFASWEALYFFLYACLRILFKPLPPAQKA